MGTPHQKKQKKQTDTRFRYIVVATTGETLLVSTRKIAGAVRRGEIRRKGSSGTSWNLIP